MAAMLFGAIAFLSSCQKEESPVGGDSTDPASISYLKSQNGKVLYGPTVPLGMGVARAWVSEDPQGNPTGVGVNLSEKALEGLPGEMEVLTLELPKNGATDFYTHIMVDWNPQGHEPGIYFAPHFDFHFYIIPEEERLAIGPDDWAEFAADPLPQYVPTDYWHTPGGVPQMGAHWVDTTSSEFTGGGFSQTFIWGSYDGEFIFWEPMITLDHLLGHPSEIFTVKQPQAYQREGWYAHDYVIEYTTRPNQYTIALVNLAWEPGE